MTKHLKPIFLTAAFILTCTFLNGCTTNTPSDNGRNDTTLSNNVNDDLTKESTQSNQSLEPTKAKNLIFGFGNYTCTTENSMLAITFQATDNPDKNTYYDKYQWLCTMPPEYPDNKYTSALISFYDKEKGVLLASLGSGAGSTYYNVYATFDGGKSWIKQDEEFQKTNTSDKLFFTDDHTFVLLDLGIGLTTPSINIFGLSDHTITRITQHARLNEIPEMITSFDVTQMTDSTHFDCSYVYAEDISDRKCTIDLADYMQ